MTRIYVSYRQSDYPNVMDTLRASLIERYGAQNIFNGFEDGLKMLAIEEEIDERLQISDVMLILIGRAWWDLLNRNVSRNLKDYTKIEVETAFASNHLFVIPVLMDDAKMPFRLDLPVSMQQLCDQPTLKLKANSKGIQREITALLETVEKRVARAKALAPAASPQQAAAQRRRESLAKERVEDLDGALKDLDEAVRLDPTYAPAFALRAAIQTKKKAPDQAIEDANIALRLDPKNAKAYGSRGTARFQKSFHTAAIADLNEAIRLNPNYVIAYNNRAWAYYALNQFKEAGVDSTTAIRLAPRNTSAYLVRGLAAQKFGDLEGAIRDFSQAILCDPKRADLYVYRAVANHHKHLYRRNLADCEEALRLNPTAYLAREYRGYAKLKIGDYDGAIADFDFLLQINPNNLVALTNRGWVYYKKGNYDRALVDCENALHIRPTMNGFQNRGLVWVGKGQIDKAIADLTEVIEMDMYHADNYGYRGVLFERKGDYERANNDYRRYILLNGKDRALAKVWMQENDDKLKGKQS